MAEEFRHHIDMRMADLMREGLSPEEARRQAHVEFGHTEAHREAARASRGLRFFDRIRFSWIDVKLGLRMLLKYPGLTLVAVFALGIGIPVGLAPMHLANVIEAPLPEDPENRVRGVRYWAPDRFTVVSPAYTDYELLGEELTTFEALAAYRQFTHNVGSDDGRASPVISAEVTASSFEILGTAPLLGRPILEEDERLGAPEVVVLGHDAWESRFAADPGVVGRTIEVSGVPHTVIGVMPQGFFFPNLQQAWLPLRHDPDTEAWGGLPVGIFGRLADGVSDDEAQAELNAVGLRARQGLPESRAGVQPQAVPFGFSFIGLPREGLTAEPGFYFFQLLAIALLLVACANVAMLVFARTATRFRELAVRTALGASRSRIVSQMFVEALALSVLAAGIGVFAIDWALGRLSIAAMVGEADLPYWLSLGVTPEALLWAIVLAGLSATVAGVVPALRITGTKIQENIRRADAGRSGIRFGGVTGALVVADVAVAIAAVALTLGISDRMLEVAGDEELTGIAAEEYLSVTVGLPLALPGSAGASDLAERRSRLGTAQQSLVERLAAEPGVRSVAVASTLPRMDHFSRLIELEGIDLPGPNSRTYMRSATVDVDFFRALETPILAGRDFDRGDLAAAVPPVIVNTVFVDRFLPGGDPIGRRLRFTSGAGPAGGAWHEIVGVVGHLGVNLVNPEGDHAVYLLGAPGSISPMQVGIHLGDAPQDFAPRLREIARDADPNLVLGAPVVLSDVYQGDWYLMGLVAGGLGLLVVILVTLAASGIYAMMSFAVSERTHEIGIRTALGAKRSAVVMTLLRRSLLQIGVGAVLGLPVAAWVLYQLNLISEGASMSAGGPLLVGVVLAGAVVAAVGLFSCVGPTRRVLRIEPNEALRGAD